MQLLEVSGEVDPHKGR